MTDLENRPGTVSFTCPQCNREMVIAPVFSIYRNVRYEAWAKLWFEKGSVGRNGIIIYKGKELAPSKAAYNITGNQVDGWTKFWKYEDEKGVRTLDELAKGH